MARLDIESEIFPGVVWVLEGPEKTTQFRAELVRNRERLIKYEAEAVAELNTALRTAHTNIQREIGAAYARGAPETWTYDQLINTSRYEQLLRAIEFEVENFNLEAEKLTERYASYAFMRDAEFAAETLAKYGVDLPTTGFIDMAVVDYYVNYPINGVVFGERFAALAADTKSKAVSAMRNGLVQGQNPNKIAREVSKITGFNHHVASTITRTTMINAANVAHGIVYDQAGIKRIRRVATLDARTCPICFDGDQEEMSVEDSDKITLHPGCR